MQTLIQYELPQWLSTLFLIAIPIPIFLMANLAKKGAPIESKNKIFYTVIGFFLVYFLYVGIASINGLFNKVFFPPIILLFTTFPLKIFLFAIVMNLAIYKLILSNLAIEDIVKVHIFRLIGAFFLIFAFYKVLPPFFAIIAGLGDVITAIISIYVTKCLKNKTHHAKKLTFIWNTFGLVDIIFTAVSAIVITKISIDTGSMGVDTLAFFPYCLIPAFAPPTIIFLHVAIYKKLKKMD